MRVALRSIHRQPPSPLLSMSGLGQANASPTYHLTPTAPGCPDPPSVFALYNLTAWDQQFYIGDQYQAQIYGAPNAPVTLNGSPVGTTDSCGTLSFLGTVQSTQEMMQYAGSWQVGCGGVSIFGGVLLPSGSPPASRAPYPGHAVVTEGPGQGGCTATAQAVLTPPVQVSAQSVPTAAPNQPSSAPLTSAASTSAASPSPASSPAQSISDWFSSLFSPSTSTSTTPSAGSTSSISPTSSTISSTGSSSWYDWFTESSVISPIPNWALVAAGAVGLYFVMRGK
jgi:hypothetical protein